MELSSPARKRKHAGSRSFQYKELDPVVSYAPIQYAPRNFMFADSQLVIPYWLAKGKRLIFNGYSGQTGKMTGSASVPLAKNHGSADNTFHTLGQLLYADFYNESNQSYLNVFNTSNQMAWAGSYPMPKSYSVGHGSFISVGEQNVVSWDSDILRDSGQFWLMNNRDHQEWALTAPKGDNIVIKSAVYSAKYGLEVLFLRSDGTNLCYYDTSLDDPIPECHTVPNRDNLEIDSKLILTDYGVLAILTDGIGLVTAHKYSWLWHLNSENYQQTFLRRAYGEIPPVVADNTLYLTINDVYEGSNDEGTIVYSYIASFDLINGHIKALELLTVDSNPTCTVSVAQPVIDTKNGFLHVFTSTQVFSETVPQLCANADPRGSRVLTLDATTLNIVTDFKPSANSRGFWDQPVQAQGYFVEDNSLVANFPVYCVNNSHPEYFNCTWTDMVYPLHITVSESDWYPD